MKQHAELPPLWRSSPLRAHPLVHTAFASVLAPLLVMPCPTAVPVPVLLRRGQFAFRGSCSAYCTHAPFSLPPIDSATRDRERRQAFLRLYADLELYCVHLESLILAWPRMCTLETARAFAAELKFVSNSGDDPPLLLQLIRPPSIGS